MALLTKLGRVAAERDRLAATGIDPFATAIEELYSPTEARIQGRRVILAGTNNYLGITFDDACIAAAREALERDGTGTTGSRMANGSYTGHKALELELAAFYEMRSAIVFSTGYQANLGMISGLAGPGDVVLLDADCHASIYDGCRLSGADVMRFRHNDVAGLDRRLERLGKRREQTLVVVEGLYSMLGDRAPLGEIAAVKRAHGVMLMVDEAHSLGVLGARGRGAVEAAGVMADTDFVVGTFSKSLGSIGGFCASDHAELDLIRYVSRPYIFTASPAPAVIGAVRAALAVLQTRPELRRRLWDNAGRLYDRLEALGYAVGPEPGPVVAVTLDDTAQALSLWQGLLAHGVYVNLMLPPATPGTQPLVRCSVSAAHTTAQIDAIGDAFATLGQVLEGAATTTHP
ncbi:MAG: aminotransferase class I/II-fold pyridoxal phosphate-dependent enzyme [Gammaproteobacteria bacterium]|nr:aminotransferase class I/II-fold pyridoxal phosphate-dependent enzyme [Gammaproteobacteria bacterium]